MKSEEGTSGYRNNKIYASIQSPCLCKIRRALQGKLLLQKRLSCFNVSLKKKDYSREKKTSQSSSFTPIAKPLTSTKVNVSPVCSWTLPCPPATAQDCSCLLVLDHRSGQDRDWQSKGSHTMPKLIKIRLVSRN